MERGTHCITWKMDKCPQLGAGVGKHACACIGIVNMKRRFIFTEITGLIGLGNSDQLEKTFTLARLHLVTEFLRLPMHLYVRLKCFNLTDTFLLADKA